MGHGRMVVVACGLLLGLVAGPVAAADPRASFVDDFSTPLGDRWGIHGGEWAIVDGRLQGLGTTPDRLHVDEPSALDLAAAVAVVDGLAATERVRVIVPGEPGLPDRPGSVASYTELDACLASSSGAAVDAFDAIVASARWLPEG